MKLVVFLGNPGKRYSKTRHNIGFIIGEHFAERHGIRCSQKGFGGFYGTGKVGNTDVCVLVPHTYMNRSGESVSQAMSFYKLETSSLVAVHDEIDFVFGRFEIKKGGGHRGHNGIRSIIQQAGNPDFSRLRFGVGRPDDSRVPVADYVLSEFSRDEMQSIASLMPEVLDLLDREILS